MKEKGRREDKSEMSSVFFPNITYNPADYIKTSTGNIVSRKALICKPQAVELPGGRCIICDDVIIRGDLAPVQVNKYSKIGAGTVLRPGTVMTLAAASGKEADAAEPPTPTLRFIPMTIGSHTQIGSNCIIEAAVIGTGCVIGNNVVISPRAVLKDFVTVHDDSVICPDAVYAPFSVVSGRPGKVVCEAPESASTLATADAVRNYRSWRPNPSP